MMNTNLRKLDMNLLLIFKVLLEENNTRRAGEVLNLSQPTVSRALTRLREYFDDELFIRSRYGLIPTNKANELKVGILSAIESLELAINPNDVFDPAKLSGTITVAMNGFIANAYSANLCQLILAVAPNVQLNVVSWDNQTADKLMSGIIDIGINYFSQDLPKTLHQEKIASDSFALICRKDHPISKQPLQQIDQKVFNVAILMIPDWNDKKIFAIDAFGSIGFRGDIKFSSNYLHSILEIVEKSDLVFPGSQLLSHKLSDQFIMVDIPASAAVPTADLSVVLSRKVSRSSKSQWLRKQIQGLFIK